jgi:hypothetical protein
MKISISRSQQVNKIKIEGEELDLLGCVEIEGIENWLQCVVVHLQVIEGLCNFILQRSGVFPCRLPQLLSKFNGMKVK